MIAALCAAPTALLVHGIAFGHSLTSYPSFKEKLSDKYKYVDDQNVVYDGQLLTSRGPATAMEFALKLAELMVGAETSGTVAKGMLYGVH